MSKGDILLVVNVTNKAAIVEVTKKAKPLISEVSEACQFSFTGLEVNFNKNSNLTGLQNALDILGEDNYALCIATERLETLDIYGNPKKFGLSKVMKLDGYNIDFR
jgi:hypothetical protein